MKTAHYIRQGKRFALLTAAWTAFALLSSAHFFFAESGDASFKELFHNIFMFYWVWAVLTPVVIDLARKYAVAERVSVRSALTLIVTAAAITVAHGILYLALIVAFGEQSKHLDTAGISAYLARHGGGDLATFAVIVGIVFLVEERRRSAERVVANAALQTRLAKADLELLRWQLHPHFLFNALNTVSTLVLQHQTERAERAISLISKYLRSALDQRPETTVRLGDELERVERYVEIEQMRFGDSVRFDTKASQAALDARIPSEVVQPLLENAIVHGSVRENGAEAIVLRADVANGRLKISVSNPAKPVNSDSQNDKGFGVRYVKERLSQFYGSDAGFNLEFHDGRAVATLDIPHSIEPRGTV